MAQSPELAGGAGFTFEDTVAAVYLAALLQEGYAPGIENRTVGRVALQQRDAGEPLDDLIVDFHASDDDPARLSLQVKRALTISQAASNSDFRDIVRDSWRTMQKPTFRHGIDRYGAVAGQVATETARALRFLCEIARSSATLADFEGRFTDAGNASATLRRVRADIAKLIEDETGETCPPAAVQAFLSHFVLIEFDFLHEGGTSLPSALNAVRACLATGHEADAPAAWQTLCRLAREEAGRAGSFDRPRLVQKLAPLLRLAAAPSLRRDLRKIEQLTRQWLLDIEDDVGGVHLERKALEAALETHLGQSRVVQIKGIPGAGKSVLLRRRVEKDLLQGPVLLLKSGRLEGTGWSSFAAANGLSGVPLVDLLVDVAATGSSTLYIDGIDRIEKQHRPIVRDVVHAVLTSPLLAGWRVVVSLRDAGIEPLRNWMGDLLSPPGFATLSVEALDDEEATELAAARPHLTSLLFGATAVREIVRRPFFAKILDRQFGAGADASSFEPQSEVDLIGNWWARGGYNAEGQAVLSRQQAIIELGGQRARHLEREVSISELSAPTRELVRPFLFDGILQEVRPGHTVRFSHDIFFEWSFFHALVDRGPRWLDEVKACGEPPVVGRVVELLSQAEFADGAQWASTLKTIEASGMRSQWTRAWLLAPVGAPDFARHEDVFEETAREDDFQRLKKALVWFQAERTTPSPNILASDLSGAERLQIADLLAWPADFPSWRRFIEFLLARASAIPVALYPDLLSVFEVWQNALGGYRNKLSNAILDQVAAWLAELDAEDARDGPPSTPSPWTGLGSNYAGFKRSLANMVLRHSAQRPDLSKTYLERVIASERLRSDRFCDIVLWSQSIVQAHPVLLVDLALSYLRQELPHDEQDREQEESRRRSEQRQAILAKAAEHRTPLEERVLNFGFSPRSIHTYGHHDWNTLAIEDDMKAFWPPSPLREPFRSLFAAAPDEAIRLLRELSNHAITAWRQLHRLDYERPGTPLPLDLTFPWGEQSFWGGDREYLWHRGEWAPKAIAAGYMALEEWALAELGRGRPPGELIQQIVTGNECVAVLGTAATIALQSESLSEAVFPLVTSQRILSADRSRMMFDLTQSSALLIGFKGGHDEPHLEAVKAANAREVRKKDLRSLLMLYFLGGGTEFSERTRAAILGFPDNLPYELEEHRNLPQATAGLLAEAKEFGEMVDRKNYQRVAVEAEGKVGIVHVSPTNTSPERLEQAREAGQRLKESGLWTWASKYFETGEVGSLFTVAGAIAFARQADSPELFTRPAEELDGMRRGALAAAAAVALTVRDRLPADDLAWARDVLQRAISVDEDRGLFWSPSSQIPWHHAIFAAKGLAADIRAGTAGKNSVRDLLALATHPLEGVSLEAVRQALALWEVDPRLGWAALTIALLLCQVPMRRRSGPSDPMHTAKETKDALAAGIRVYRQRRAWPDLPLPPPAWIKGEAPNGGRPVRRFLDDDTVGDDDVVDPTEAWVEPPVYWQSKYAAAILGLIPFSVVLASEAGPHLLSFVSGVLAWTIEKIAPPWLKKGRREWSGTRLYEWTHGLGRMLGRIAGELPLADVRRTMLDPIFALEGERCWDLLSPLVDAYICASVLDAETVPSDAVDLLQLCLDRMLQDSAFNPSAYRGGDFYGFDLPQLNDAMMFVAVQFAGGAARYVNGDWSEVDRIVPVIDRFVRAAGWSSTIMSKYLTLCERSKANYPAEAFADEVLDVIDRQAASLKGWYGTVLPARIAALVQHFADRETPMPLLLGQKLLRILDLLVDMGDRRSAALQLSETFREIQTT